VWDSFKREGSKLPSMHERELLVERTILPALGDRPIAEIMRSEIEGRLDHSRCAIQDQTRSHGAAKRGSTSPANAE
jgi:hypothetical protein